MQVFLLTAALAGGAALLAPGGAERDVSRAPVASPASASAARGFLPNGGQWPDAVRFRSSAPGVRTWFVDDGWWLTLRSTAPELGLEPGLEPGLETDRAVGRETAVALRMSFEGAFDTRAVGEGAPFETRYSYFVGADPARWATNLTARPRVRWPASWDGIDLVARYREPGAGLFQYDLELAPFADLGAVVLRCEGHTDLAVDAAGNLVIGTDAGPLVQTPPIAWQMVDGAPSAFECRFRVLDDARYGFVARGRDPRLAAVVDPALVFSTYLSGQAESSVDEIAPGPDETVFVAGTTISDDFPTTPGAYEEFSVGAEDGFVSRVAADGTMLVWSTYVGGSDIDLLSGLAVDAAGEATVSGTTFSTDFPTTPGAYDESANGFADGFALRLGVDGDALLWATYLGGSLNDFCNDVGIDAGGTATVVGATNGGGFPSVPGSYDTSFGGGVFGGDAFCVRLDPTGSQLVFGTFLGAGKDDGATTVAVEAGGEVCIAGVSTGGNFPITPGAFDETFSAPVDAWVARLDAAGSQLVWSTWLGGSGTEDVTRIALDGSGAATVVGWTDAGDFPTAAGALDPVFDGETEGFLLRLDATGQSLEFGTFVGGEADDDVAGLALMPGGDVLITGTTTSPDFWSTPGSFDPSYNIGLATQNPDVFVTRLTPAADALVYSTFFGTEGSEWARDVDVDATGAAIFGGQTSAFLLPTSPTALQPTFNASAIFEGFVTRLTFVLHPIRYGAAKTGSFEAQIGWDGFPSLAEDDFQIRIDGAPPHERAILFHGFAPQASPFWGGTIYVQPPLQRHRPVFPGPFGFKSIKLKMQPAWVGQTLYFQFWYRDPGSSFKVGLSDALEVVFHP